MFTKTFGRILTALSLALLPACTKAPEEKAGERLVITVRAESPATKTVLSDDGTVTSFTFKAGDEMGFFADGVLDNAKLICTDEAGGRFSGHVEITEEQSVARPSVDYYAYYPYVESAGNNPRSLVADLPHRQRAPFDGRADFLVSDPVTDVYDPEAFPALTFEFNTHLFAVVKLSITNSDDALADERIQSIGLQSTETPLSGRFYFNAADGSMEFETDPNYLIYEVLMEYDTPPALGTGVTHSVYAVVNPADYASGTLNLVVNTTRHIFTLPSHQAFRPHTYQMTSLPTVDVSKASSQDRIRTIVLWGDSITGPGMEKAVRAQLGKNWKVIAVGSSGDTAFGIAARQGGLPVFTQASAFTLPASSEEYVSISGIYWRDGYTYGLIDHLYFYNPLLIKGIECEISGSKTAGFKLRRLTDGPEPIVISPRSEVSTYGSRTHTDADVIQVYMGTNGRPSDDKLIELHDRMKAHLTNPYAEMFVLGFHQSTTDFPTFWTQDYVDAFTDHYGADFIDQRTLGNQDAVNLMKEIGQIKDESEISETDWEFINRGDWPLSWSRGPGDPHPNYDYGNVVQAILLRRRMTELGLL